MIYWVIGGFIYLVIAMIVAACVYESSFRGDAVDSVFTGLFWLLIVVIGVTYFVISFPLQLSFGEPEEPKPPPEEENEV